MTEGMVMGGTPAPFELLVQEVTDQGKRRPMRVARLYAPGTKSILAELLGVRLVWFKGDEFVLAGADVSPGDRGPVHAAQSWLCKLALPPHALGYSARFLYEQGRQLPMGQVNNRWANSSNSQLRVSSVMHEQLARHTTRALLRRDQHDYRLLDCELDFMGEEKFQLSGFEQLAETINHPARLLRQGWLMAIDTQTPEQAEYVRSVQKSFQR
ncbi:hypothetical protein ASF61_06950 [Duganella sp. Leaf126]|uniref:hypothetical protein n=1 Tax=Duganella sp. Leaf126 TaxID=1736266 RepID=UPI0006F42EB2|nr:hypothetical protein [Duganella sp. Leaf126]KQQ40484.1 hypothetical protein ASF61_06950 [Duganella sp. Leaf126]